MNKTILFIYAETPIHPGASPGISYVDLPVQRESFTGFPVIQGSGLKGSLREFFEKKYPDQKDKIETIFGPSPEKGGSEFAGALSIGEAKILFFPVRSLFGVFAYITSPFVLERFKRDLKFVNNTISIPDIKSIGENEVLVPTNESKIVHNDKAVFDEFEFDVRIDDNSLKNIANFFRDNIFSDNEEYNPWRENFISRVAVVSENVFSDFVQMGTEIVTRNRIDDTTGVVAEKGGLWTEEFIPSETIFYSVLFSTKPFKKDPPNGVGDEEKIIEYVKDKLNNKRFQIGGDYSIGRGIVMAHFLNKEVKNVR